MIVLSTSHSGSPAHGKALRGLVDWWKATGSVPMLLLLPLPLLFLLLLSGRRSSRSLGRCDGYVTAQSGATSLGDLLLGLLGAAYTAGMLHHQDHGSKLHAQGGAMIHAFLF